MTGRVMEEEARKTKKKKVMMRRRREKEKARPNPWVSDEIKYLSVVLLTQGLGHAQNAKKGMSLPLG